MKLMGDKPVSSFSNIKSRLNSLIGLRIGTNRNRPLGILAVKDKAIFFSQGMPTLFPISMASSYDGTTFQSSLQNLKLTSYSVNPEITRIGSSDRSSVPRIFIQAKSDVGTILFTGLLKDLKITALQPVTITDEYMAIVPKLLYQDSSIVYFGERILRVAYTKNFKTWSVDSKPLIDDSRPLEVASVQTTSHGILVVYYRKEIENGHMTYSLYMALFDKKNPRHLLWKTEDPVWQSTSLWRGQRVKPMGIIEHEGVLISYWLVDDSVIFGVYHSGFIFDPRSISLTDESIKLVKHENNPIIEPNPKNDWEAFNTFNPAAIYADNKVHILYRAQGFDYISTVGYAVSRDGVAIDGRSDKPVYSPRMSFEDNPYGFADPGLISGGGYGGVEDPRLTILGDRVYMTYVAFDGWSPQRLALTSILLKNFLSKRWLWTKPVLISPPGVIDKSGCLFPEKINGKYVFLHRVFPNILLDYVDDLRFDTEKKLLHGRFSIPVRPAMWDSRKIGAGAPPIKTRDGWLLIYYGVDNRDASKYHIGAMILDLSNPAHVLYRSRRPILEPTELYENSGFKPGIAYPCGAVVIGDNLLVYYGAADSVVCVATAKLSSFLDELKLRETAHLKPVQIREINL